MTSWKSAARALRGSHLDGREKPGRDCSLRLSRRRLRLLFLSLALGSCRAGQLPDVWRSARIRRQMPFLQTLEEIRERVRSILRTSFARMCTPTESEISSFIYV